MKLLKIRAWLVNGFAAKDPWSPAIDGILAAVVMRQRLGDEAFRSPRPSDLAPVEGLPLAVVTHGSDWWYAASSPIVVGEAGREQRHFHRRFDDQYERYLGDGIGKVMTAAGPYKSTRLHDTRIICRAVEWHVVGIEPEIAALLDGVDQVGARRGVGYGQVSRWEIGPGDEAIARRHRPIPAAATDANGRMVMPWGIVPPSRTTIRECVMPGSLHVDA